MKHKSENALRGIYVLTILSLLLPWFTYNASIMGYCWGYLFLSYFLIPILISGLYLFRFRGNLIWGFLCRICAVVNLGILIYALGHWQTLCNIRDGFQLMDGLRTAQSGFWLAAVFHISFFVMVFVSLFSKKETLEESE